MKRRRFLQAAPVAAALLPQQALEAQQQRPQGTPPPQGQQVVQPPIMPGVANAPIVHLDTLMPEQAGDPVTPKFLSAAQFATLKTLCEILMPAGQNRQPGAIEAKVPEFLDFLLTQSPMERQQTYKQGLDGLKSLSAANADKLLAPLKQPWTYEAPKDPVAKFLRAAKADIRTATMNSREWAAVSTGGRRGATGVGLYWNKFD